MTGRCYSTLTDLAEDGYTRAAQRRLAGGNRKFPLRVDFTRSDVVRHRVDHADRMSISGVQDKISVRLERGRLVPVETDGEFILKPIPSIPLQAFGDQVPANEHVTMQVAEQVFGIEVAANALVLLADDEPAYITRRFDRFEDGRKRSQEDFCSLSERSPETHGRQYKYTGSYEMIGQLIQRYVSAAPIELDRLMMRLGFMYLISNGDAHLKNWSVYETGAGDMVLTPCYDLVCTTLHVPNEGRLALDWYAGDALSPSQERNGFETGADLLQLGDRFGVPAKRCQAIVAQLTASTNWDQLVELVGRSFLSAEAQGQYLALAADRRRALQMR